MSLCKKYDCSKCEMFNKCGGCEKCDGCPFGKLCVLAKIIKEKGFEESIKVEKKIIDAINNLGINKLHIDSLNVLPGSYVNLEYPLPNGNKVKLIDDEATYFANQIEIDNESCYGIISDGSFIVVAKYGFNGINPELIIYKKI